MVAERETAALGPAIAGGPPLDGRDLQQEQQRCFGGEAAQVNFGKTVTLSPSSGLKAPSRENCA